VGNNAYDGNQQLTVRAQDDVTISAGYEGSTADSAIVFRTNNATESNNAERMRIDKDGNVGIGTGSPNYKLDVRGDILVSGALYLGIAGGTSPSTKIVTDTSSNGIVVSDNSGNLTQITAKGLILSENPTYDITNGGQLWMLNHASGTNTQTGYLAFQAIDNASNNQLYSEISGAISSDATTAESGLMDFNVYHTGSNETVMRMVSGSVGIGLTDPAYKLDVSMEDGSYTGVVSRFTSGGSPELGISVLSGQDMRIGTISNKPFHLFSNDTTGTDNDRIGLTVSNTNQNIGIGTTGPNAKLHVQGDALVSGSLTLSGTALGGRIGFADTNEVGLYAGTTEQIRLGVSNSYLKGTNWVFNGGGYFRVNGTKQLQFGSNDEHYIYNDGTDLILKTVTTAGQGIVTDSFGDTTFKSNGTARMTILSGGAVGIGTTTPEFALDVNGDIRIEDAHYLRFGDDDSDSQWIMQHAGADLNFGEVGVADNVLFLEAGGRVGVGTNNPDGGWLHVNSAGTDQTLKLESTDGNVDTIFKDNGGSGIIRFATDTFKFYTDAAYSVNPLNLKGADVGIGTTSPTTKLDVRGTTLLSGTTTVTGDLGVSSDLAVTGSTLAVQKTIKTDVADTDVLSDSYSHYMVPCPTSDAPASITITITSPPSPSVGDEYFIISQIGDTGGPFSGETGTVRIVANTGQTINGVATNINIDSRVSATPAYKTAHMICVDTNTWAMTISDVGPVA